MLTIGGGYSQNLPPGNYVLMEYYCKTPDCDCRRVMLHIFSEQIGQVVAVVNYGWENRKFYEKRLGDKDEVWINELKGPSLNTGSFQSPYANELLTIIRDSTLKDKNYVDRLKRHYVMFKQKIMSKDARGENQIEAEASMKIGRNDPCTCGNGLKYKKCCGR
ncbi:SEC-C domain-containing protein [Paenibacillus alkaliterrae]|uniref:YecA family protein n=1 Tax=Paenibacillus alkaliterrae TaxID=320909 RepID=UPI001F359CD4|nr:SEC-C metal-binding domain-containing protein [Paenibacillus alkaliterrae]MCF2940953.1 SEC-C domain-containing protein [Paenibacillus alkaliterrae]